MRMSDLFNMFLIPIKKMDQTRQGIKNILNKSLILIQNKTNTKNPNISFPKKILYHMQQLTYTPT